MSEKKLEPKQKRFCEEYIIDLNATQAAIRAGYSQKTAKEIGFQHLTKLHIQTYIQELKDKRSAKTEITAEKVLLELAKCGFSNIQDYISNGYEIDKIQDIDSNKAGAIQSIKVKTTHGEFASTEISFRLHDKLSALDKIAKHIGFFSEDNKQKSTTPQTYIIGGKEVHF